MTVGTQGQVFASPVLSDIEANADKIVQLIGHESVEVYRFLSKRFLEQEPWLDDKASKCLISGQFFSIGYAAPCRLPHGGLARFQFSVNVE